MLPNVQLLLTFATMRWLLFGASGAAAGIFVFFGLRSSEVNGLVAIAGIAGVVAAVEWWIDAKRRQVHAAQRSLGRRLIHTALVIITTFAGGAVAFALLFVTMVAP